MGCINEDIRFEWNQQLAMLKKLTDARVVFLVQENLHILVSTLNEDKELSAGVILEANKFCLDQVFQEGKAFSDMKRGLFISAPVRLQNDTVWGALVIVNREKFADLDQTKSYLLSFCNIIGDKIRLTDYQTSNGALAGHESSDTDCSNRNSGNIRILNDKLLEILSATNTILSINDENGNVIFHSHNDISTINKKCFEYYHGSTENCVRCPRSSEDKKKTSFLYEEQGRTIRVVALPYEVAPSVWHVAEVRVDVSDFIARQSEIDELKDRFDFSMNAVNIAYFEYYLTNRLVRSNHIFENITGFNCNNQIIDLSWFKSRIHNNDLQQVVEAYQNAKVSEDKNIKVEGRVLNGNNQYMWVRFSGLLHMDGEKVVKVSGVLMDISDTKDLMLALLNERNKSLKASEAKSMFLANMSHEIRTPMNAIIGFSELLSKKIKDESLKGFLNSIRSSGNVLLDLINDLLDMEKIEAGKMNIRKQNTRFKVLLKDIEQTFSLKFREKNLAFSVQTNEDFPQVIFVDSLKIKQVLLNLINNAFKFTNEGQVSVLCSFIFDDTGQKGSLIISVEDTGIGIRKEKQELIFEPFIQNRESNQKEYQGTGLGLAIVQKLVQKMGGEITLESKPGVGSKFIILIHDIEAKNDVNAEIEQELQSEVRFSKEKLMVIDSVETNREVLSAMCANLNLVCQTHAGGEGLANEIANFDPQVIIMDIRKEKKNQFETLKSIRNIHPINKIPVIAISSSSNPTELELAYSKGYDGFMSKPIPEQKLITELSKFIKPIDHSAEKDKHHVIDQTISLSEDDIQKIRPYFNDEFLALWNGLKDLLSSKKLKVFVAELNHITKEVEWDELQNFVGEMETAIKSFDFELIQKLIKRFQVFVDVIK